MNRFQSYTPGRACILHRKGDVDRTPPSAHAGRPVYSLSPHQVGPPAVGMAGAASCVPTLPAAWWAVAVRPDLRGSAVRFAEQPLDKKQPQPDCRCNLPAEMPAHQPADHPDQTRKNCPRCGKNHRHDQKCKNSHHLISLSFSSYAAVSAATSGGLCTVGSTAKSTCRIDGMRPRHVAFCCCSCSCRSLFFSSILLNSSLAFCSASHLSLRQFP